MARTMPSVSKQPYSGTRTARATAPVKKGKNMSAMITSKIVDVTGNKATQAFVGKSVVKRNTANGTVYAIGKTGYVLSPAEYRAFEAAGAIAEVADTKPKKKLAEKSAAKAKAKKIANDAAETVKKKRPRRKAQEEEKSQVAGDTLTGFNLDPDTTGFFETSAFLRDYPAPEFNIEEPKLGFFDKSEDFGSKISRFFDKLGQSGRDKLVASFESDEDDDA